jgi:hypothetical protein
MLTRIHGYVMHWPLAGCYDLPVIRNYTEVPTARMSCAVPCCLVRKILVNPYPVTRTEHPGMSSHDVAPHRIAFSRFARVRSLVIQRAGLLHREERPERLVLAHRYGARRDAPGADPRDHQDGRGVVAPDGPVGGTVRAAAGARAGLAVRARRGQHVAVAAHEGPARQVQERGRTRVRARASDRVT